MTRPPAKPYFVAEIAYNPSWPKTPWYVHRVGVVPEQGGPNFGMETISFESLEEACEYLKETIKRDMLEYEKMIEQKDHSFSSS